jgi:hypothetical protein
MFDWPEHPDRESVACSPAPQYLPQIGDSVGIRPLDEHGAFYLDEVLDIRHYYDAGEHHQEIRILLGDPTERPTLSADLDRLDELLRDLLNERGEIERVIATGRDVADKIRQAANTAGEAAGSISMEAGRLRRG